MLKNLISSFLSKEMDFYQKSVDNYFERDLGRDIKVFQKLHPKDDFGRSIAQHKCQVYPFKKEVWAFNCISFFMMPFAMMALLLKRKVLVSDDRSKIVCYNCSNLPGSLPEALSDKSIRSLSCAECPFYLRVKDVPFLIRLCFRSICHPFLAFRVMLKVARYRAIIDSFEKLEIIAITGEFVDTSSAMTQYCRENGVKHYSFMQGDMFGSPRVAFFHFDICYVWDQHYVDVFIEYGANPEQFMISLPGLLKKNDGENIHKTVDYLYYLGGYPNEDLTEIRTAIDRLVAKGFSCVVRPHPRWSDMEEVEKVFDGVSIQNTKAVNVIDSILMTKNVIGLCSTVMIQAYYNDVHVVIDDLSRPSKFAMLEKYQYIMLNKPHELLSEITRNCI